MRHVLITGGLGFIGRHLVESLVAAGDRVTVLDLKYEVIPGARTIVGNIRYPFDPLFDQPYEASGSGTAQWEQKAQPPQQPQQPQSVRRVSPNIKPKRKVASLLGGGG